MDENLRKSRFQPLEGGRERTSRSSSNSPDAAERFRRSLYEPPDHQSGLHELNEGENTQSWLTAAQEGFRRFERSYRNGDIHWKRFLTQTTLGKELQAVFLDVKPLVTIYRHEIHDEQMVDMILRNAKDDLSVLDLRPMGHGLRIFSEKNVDKVLKAHPYYFPTYDSASSISSYLSELGRQPVTQQPEHLDIQRGLLHGFPLQASEAFPKYQEARNTLFDLIEEFPENSEKKHFLQKYFDTRNYNDVNAFRDTNQKEMREILDTHLPYMPEDAKQHILNLRYIHAPGILYVSDHPTSPENQTLIQRVQNIFQFSGMNDFLQTIGILF